jgi:hypothetical protein
MTATTTTMTRMMMTSFLDLPLDGFGMLSLKAEWRIGGLAEWWNGGMAEMAEWQNGGNGGNGRNGGTICKNTCVGIQLGPNVAKWQKERSNGRMVEWLDGYLPTTFMVHADDNNDDNDDNTF